MDLPVGLHYAAGVAEHPSLHLDGFSPPQLLPASASSPSGTGQHYPWGKVLPLRGDVMGRDIPANVVVSVKSRHVIPCKYIIGRQAFPTTQHKTRTTGSPSASTPSAREENHYAGGGKVHPPPNTEGSCWCRAGVEWNGMADIFPVENCYSLLIY